MTRGACFEAACGGPNTSPVIDWEAVPLCLRLLLLLHTLCWKLANHACFSLVYKHSHTAASLQKMCTNIVSM